MWRALSVTLELFRWLAEETARRLGVTYPKTVEARVKELVDTVQLRG